MSGRRKADNRIEQLHARLRAAHSDEERLKIYLEFFDSAGAISPRDRAREADTALLTRTLYKFPLLAAALYLIRVRLRAHPEIGDIKGALHDLENACSCCRNSNSVEAGRITITAAQLYEEMSRYNDAIEIYESFRSAESAPLRSKASVKEREEWAARTELRADACYRLGNRRLLQGAFTDALEAHQAALELREELDRPELAAASLAALARLSTAMNEPKAAKSYLTSSLKAARACERRGVVAYPVAEAHEHLAEVELARGRFDEADSHVLAARSLYNQLQYGIGISRTHLIDGRIRERQGKFRQATQQYANAYKILDKCAATQMLPEVLIAMGKAHRGMRQLDNALFLLLDALRMARQAEDALAERDAHMELSRTYEQAEQFREALEHYKKASHLARELGNEQHRREVARMQAGFDIRHAGHMEDQLRKTQERAGRTRQEMRVAVARLGVQTEKLRVIQRELKGALKALADRNIERLREVLKTAASEVEKELSTGDDQWHALLKRVIDVDINHVACLKRKFPSLTEAELEVCGLELLQRTAREIAEARGREIKTVYKQRQIIRRKTECPRNLPLGEHLKTSCT